MLTNQTTYLDCTIKQQYSRANYLVISQLDYDYKLFYDNSILSQLENFVPNTSSTKVLADSSERWLVT